MRYKNVLTNSDHGLLLINRNDTVIGSIISEVGNWEIQYINLLKSLIEQFYPKNSAIEIIDAGSNIGVYSLSLSKIDGFTVKVISIEAQRLIYQMLNANIALNSLENVWTYHRVVSDKNDEVKSLECTDLNFAGNFGAYEITNNLAFPDQNGMLMPAEEVKTLSLDSLPLQNCVLVKIDVEGMEDVALLGSINLIKKHKPILFFEKHKTDYIKVKGILKECGYAVWELLDDNVLGLRKEWDINIDGISRIDL